MNLNEKILLSRVDLKALGIGQSNTTLLRLESRGAFPRRLRVGGTGVCWRRDEILNWFEQSSADRSKHHYSDGK